MNDLAQSDEKRIYFPDGANCTTQNRDFDDRKQFRREKLQVRDTRSTRLSIDIDRRTGITIPRNNSYHEPTRVENQRLDSSMYELVKNNNDDRCFRGINQNIPSAMETRYYYL